MSIINDALKKTQQAFKPKKKDKVQEDPKPQDTSNINVYEKMYKERDKNKELSDAVAKSRKQSSKGSETQTSNRAPEIFKTIFAFIFLVASLSFSFKFLSNHEPLQKFLGSSSFSIGKKQTSRSKIAKYIPKKRKYKADDLFLNGISLIDGAKIALINDEIYQIGDIVNNKKITSITHDEVELQDDEKIYTITVR